MTFLERDLEDIIFNASVDVLNDRGLHSFRHNAHTYKQLQIGNYGIADIVQVRKSYDEGLYARGFISHCLEVSVFELKKR